MRGSPRLLAQRPLPSMITATCRGVAEAGEVAQVVQLVVISVMVRGVARIAIP